MNMMIKLSIVIKINEYNTSYFYKSYSLSLSIALLIDTFSIMLAVVLKIIKSGISLYNHFNESHYT
jgi:hypothetical protein